MSRNESHGADHDLPMTFQEHLAELRERLIKATRAIAIGMIGGLLAADGVQGDFLDLVARNTPEAVLGVAAPWHSTFAETRTCHLNATAVPFLRAFQADRAPVPSLGHEIP